MDDGSASIFCFTPLRVTAAELDQLRAAPSSAESSSGPVCSAPPIPQGPCPVCPRLEQEFEPWRQAAYWKAQHRRALAREAQLKTEVDRLQALLRLREQQLFGRKTEASAAQPTAPLATPPPRHRVAAEVSNPVSPVPSGVTIPTSRPSSRTTNSHPIGAGVPDAVSPSTTSPAPRIRSSSKSMSGLIAGSSAVAAIGPPARVPPIPASSPHRRRPGSSPSPSWEFRSG